jgi:hypothetical protein
MAAGTYAPDLGYFSSLSALTTAFPASGVETGAQARVGGGVGPVWNNAGIWYAVTQSGSFGSVAIAPSGDTSGATDTAAIQAALNNLSYTSTTPNSIQLGGGVYYINAALTIPNAAGFYIHGTSRQGTVINQVTNNTPIFNFTGNNNNNNFDIGYMTLQWSNNQTFAQTNAVAFLFNGGASYQAFNFSIHHFQAVNGYRFISQTTNIAVWGMTVSDGIFQPTLVGSGVNLSASTAGQPTITLRNLYFSCASTAANEPVIQISNVDNVLLESVELNGGSYSSSVPQIAIGNGLMVTIISSKTEGLSLAGSTSTTGSGAAVVWQFLNTNVNAQSVKAIGANITGGTSGTPVYAAFLGVGAITYGQLSANGLNWQNIGNYATFLPYTQAYSSSNTLEVMSMVNVLGVASGTQSYAPVNVAKTTSTSALAPRVFADAMTPDTTQTNGDSSITLTVLSARYIWFNVTLTANRTVTLPTGTFEGQEFKIVRKAATPGAFTLTVTDPVSGFSEVIASNTNGFSHWRCTYVSGTYQWFPYAAGTL